MKKLRTEDLVDATVFAICKAASWDTCFDKAMERSDLYVLLIVGFGEEYVASNYSI